MDIFVGVVGYSEQKFDKEKARKLINLSYDEIENKHKDDKIYCVSGLTNLGIPALAYEEAVKRGWKTIGVACSKAEEYELFPVDHKIIEGSNWGDESKTFLSMLDCFIRIGGGKQSKKETEEAKKNSLFVIEHDLEVIE